MELGNQLNIWERETVRGRWGGTWQSVRHLGKRESEREVRVELGNRLKLEHLGKRDSVREVGWN